MLPRSPKRPPTPFGDYLLLDRAGVGGMAEVWRAKMFGAEGQGRLVALKRILPTFAEDEEFMTMILDEAKLGIQLLHTNIAQTFEQGQIGPLLYLSQEYVPGKSLSEIFKHSRETGWTMPIHLVCACITGMCEGLDYAHRKKDARGRDLNIIHRGLSLADVLVSYEGDVKVIDFGIAKAEGRITHTQPGVIKGKFGYLSPEQLDGLPLDRRSDVFAIGVCLYELLTGQRLFDAETPLEAVEKLRKAKVTPPSVHNRRIPKALERIVLRALAPDVSERYLYASELSDDLRHFLAQHADSGPQLDLRRYLRVTFAEDLRIEEERRKEYAQIEPPKDFDLC
ncbi:MAG TPA: serine/threonine-protein kinase [Hyalangium sp.]|nr:serine/threonine-protein kinase [Hyalangium sp.]